MQVPCWGATLGCCPCQGGWPAPPYPFGAGCLGPRPKGGVPRVLGRTQDARGDPLDKFFSKNYLDCARSPEVLRSESMDARAQAIANLRRWKNDPIAFVREVLRAEPDDWQAEFLLSARDNPRTAAKACKGPGKSCGDAWVALWAMTCFAYLKGYAISITGENLRDNLWAELATWQQKSPFLTEMFQWQAERFFAKEAPENWFISARQWSKSADKTQQSNTLAGLHAEHTLVIIDEAGDIPSAVTEAADASLSTGAWNRIIMTGNPTQTSGPLYDACTSQRHLWKVIEITGDPDDPKRAKRIKVDWAREKIAALGRYNPWVLINVFGQFPPAGWNKLLGPEHCVASYNRFLDDKAWKPHAHVMGVDPARFGDDEAIIMRRRGRLAFAPRGFRNLSSTDLAEQVLKEILDEKVDMTFIDVTGQGVGVYDHIVFLGHADKVMPINFGEKAQEPERYVNRRTEMYDRAAKWVKEEGKLPHDPQLNQELCAHEFDYDPKSRMLLTPKDDVKMLIQRSPDRADAFVLTFANLAVAPKIPYYEQEFRLPFSHARGTGVTETEYDIYGS